MTATLTRPNTATVTMTYDEHVSADFTSPAPVIVHVDPVAGCTDQFAERNIGYKAARAVNNQLIALTDMIISRTPGLVGYRAQEKRERLTLHRGELHDAITPLWQRRHLTGGTVVLYSPTFGLTVTIQETIQEPIHA